LRISIAAVKNAMTDHENGTRPITCIEDLATLAPGVMALLCKTMDAHTLMVALKAAPDDVREAVFAGFPPRQPGVLGDQVPAVGFVTLEEVEQAQRMVIDAANTLIDFQTALE
jgi:flagellar motor switch protein FliG